MTKLDHSKGGRYEPDPAREQPFDDFVEPDDMIVKRKHKKPPSLWAAAMKALRRREIAAKDIALTQAQLLSALGHSKKTMRKSKGATILKRLVAEGLLLKDGKPNVDHPRVAQIISERGRGEQK